MKTSLLIRLMWMGLLPAVAQARLGDTERQCVERYGSAERPKPYAIKPEPLIAGLTEAIYRYQGWRLRMAFAGGKVVAQEYQKELPHPAGKAIKPEELQPILEAERGGGDWERNATHPLKTGSPAQVVSEAIMGAQHWKRSDGAGATLTPLAYSIVFYSREGIEAAQQAEAAKAKQRRDSVPKF